jgi:hypothetical protein
MKVKVNQIILDENEKPIILKTGESAKTLKDVIVASITIPVQGEEEQIKMERYEVWKKLRGIKTEVDFSVEELALIKKYIGKFQPPIIMGQCFEMIEIGKVK